MSRNPLRVLPLLVAGVVLMLAGCGNDATPSATAPSATGGATTAAPTPTTPVTSPATGDLRSACRAAEVALDGIIKKVFDHPNDPVGAATVYADGADRLRKLGAGTPIEAQVNKLAATMESIASRLKRGDDDGDTSELPRAAAPLQQACT